MDKGIAFYIDEGGDFSLGNDSLDILIISVVAFSPCASVARKLSTLEENLAQIGFTGPIHTAPLVRKSNEYEALSLRQRREVFWALYNFAKVANLHIVNYLLDKRPLASHAEVRKHAGDIVDDLFSLPIMRAGNCSDIFYDGGQRPLMEILFSATEQRFSPEHYHADFDHDGNRFFQIADLMTYVARLVFKQREGIAHSSSDQIFFTKDNLRLLTKDIVLKAAP